MEPAIQLFYQIQQVEDHNGKLLRAKLSEILHDLGFIVRISDCLRIFRMPTTKNINSLVNTNNQEQSYVFREQNNISILKCQSSIFQKWATLFYFLPWLLLNSMRPSYAQSCQFTSQSVLIQVKTKLKFILENSSQVFEPDLPQTEIGRNKKCNCLPSITNIIIHRRFTTQMPDYLTQAQYKNLKGKLYQQFIHKLEVGSQILCRTTLAEIFIQKSNKIMVYLITQCKFFRPLLLPTFIFQFMFLFNFQVQIFNWYFPSKRVFYIYHTSHEKLQILYLDGEKRKLNFIYNHINIFEYFLKIVINCLFVCSFSSQQHPEQIQQQQLHLPQQPHLLQHQHVQSHLHTLHSRRFFSIKQFHSTQGPQQINAQHSLTY